MRFKYPKLFYLVLLALGILPYWLNLGVHHLYMWDEASYALNALDMADGGSLICTSTGGIPDVYNPKPPFALWLQALSIKCFGISEWALRFPSAIASTGTALLIFAFFRSRPWLGLTTVYVLAATAGYNTHHVARTSDLDALMIVFMIAYTFSWLEFMKGNKQMLFWFFLSAFLAYFSKGIIAWSFLPFLIVASSILFKRWSWLGKPAVYLGAILTLGILVSYYWLRINCFPPEQGQQMLNDLLRFSSNVHSWEAFPWHYYIDQIIQQDFKPFVYLLPLAIPALFIRHSLRWILTISLILVLGHLSIVSLAGTKTYWYEAPVYPLLAILLTTSIFVLGEKLWREYAPQMTVVVSLSLMIFSSVKANKLSSQDYPPDYIYDMELEGAFMRYALENQLLPGRFKVIKDVRHPEEHYDQILFYGRLLNDKGYRIEIGSRQNAMPTDTLLICQDAGTLDAQYDTLFTWKQGCRCLIPKEK